MEKYFTQLQIICIPHLSQSWMTAFITLFKKQIWAKMPFSCCGSMDRIFLMNKNTLNSLNAEDIKIIHPLTTVHKEISIKTPILCYICIISQE